MNSFDQIHIQNKRSTQLPGDFQPIDPNVLDPAVWGPHYWFFLQTVAQSYPNMPTATTKRKYYDFMQNLPLFIPNEEIGNKFSVLLDEFPVSPYLDSRDSFIRWVHFMHNKINVRLGKEEISLFAALDNYKRQYVPKQIKLSEKFQIQKEYIIASFTITCLILIIVFYR